MAQGFAWPESLHGPRVCMARGFAWPESCMAREFAWPEGLHGPMVYIRLSFALFGLTQSGHVCRSTLFRVWANPMW
jgi:hypothetical protein